MRKIYVSIIIACLFLNFNKLIAQTEWTGPNITFTKTANADWTLAINQDQITANVWITRGDLRGLFNIAPGKETGWNTVDKDSPMDTEWANGSIADGIENLTFETWDDSNWDGSKNNPSFFINKNKVLHLITDNIYIDCVLKSWSSGGGIGTAGGGFSYERSTDQSLSTDEFELNNKFKIYPNPSNDFIQISGITNSLNFRVHTILGTEILNGNIEKEGEINIQNLVKGIYVIHFENGIALKFVKN